MIKIIDNKNDIIRLWQEAFHDSKEDIEFFVDNIQHGICIGYFEEDRAVSMLYLVDCNYKWYECSYIYAACTEKKSRGKGYMASLLDYCKDNCNNRLCLIPANEGLVEYYNSHSLDLIINIDDIAFDENDEICDYFFEGCELESPIGLMYDKGD